MSIEQTATRPPARNARWQRHVRYALVITSIAILSGYTNILPVFRDKLLHYLAISDQQFGFLFSMTTVGGIVTVLLGGALADRWGPRRVLFVCLLGVGGAMGLLGVAGAHWGMMAGALALNSLFVIPFTIAASAYLARLFPRHRRRVLSLNLAAISIGGLLLPLLAEGWLSLTRAVPVITFAHVLHVPFLVVGGLLLAASRWYRGPQAPAAKVATTSAHFWQSFLIPPHLRLLVLLLALHSTVDTTLNIWMSRFLGSASFHTHPIVPGFVMAGFALVYIVSRAILALIPERFGRHAFLILPGLLGGAVLILGILSRQFWLTAGGYVLGAFLWSTEYPTMLGVLAQTEMKRFGAAMALAQLIAGGLTFLLLNADGALINRLGEARMWQVMCGNALLFPLVGIGGAIWVVWQRRLIIHKTTDPRWTESDQRGSAL